MTPGVCPTCGGNLLYMGTVDGHNEISCLQCGREPEGSFPAALPFSPGSDHRRRFDTQPLSLREQRIAEAREADERQRIAFVARAHS